MRNIRMIRFSLSAVLAAALLLSNVSWSAEPQGRLLIIGGGTRRTSVDIFSRLIEGAGGKEHARIGILPTASRSFEGSHKLAESLVRFGLSKDQIEILDITPFNAAKKASDPELVEQIQRCTGILIAGGDQRRITAALMTRDGDDSPVLAAIRGVFQKGGIIAGTSAGAAVQSELMIAAAGLSADALDEGFDPLDFGKSNSPKYRGLNVSRGLGVFRGGIIDQHFNQYRGRLSRLARAVVESHNPLGFGIDENTAIAVDPDGVCEVVGTGSMTILDADAARCVDGPLGCRIENVGISVLQQGDRFDPRTRKAIIHPEKRVIVPGKEENNGNHIIPDIAGEGGVNYALISGLAENSRRYQTALMLKYTGDFAHGYRFNFRKTAETKCYGGYVREEYSNAILNVRFNVEPVVNGATLSSAALPVDLPKDESRHACAGIWFRGILQTDSSNRLRLEDHVLTGEFAQALARVLPIDPPRQPIHLADLDPASPEYDEYERMVGAGLFSIEADGRFPIDKAVPRLKAAEILVRAWEIYRGQLPLPIDLNLEEEKVGKLGEHERAFVAKAIDTKLLTTIDGKFHPARPLSRKELALALCRLIDFAWMTEKPITEPSAE